MSSTPITVAAAALLFAASVHGAAGAEQVPRYGRFHHEFAPGEQVEEVEFIAPSGAIDRRPAFAHQPAELVYDDRGYERIVPRGSVRQAVRCTPVEIGRYRWRALAGGRMVQEGEFECVASNHPGYVQISRRDGRYFALSDGSPYCAIGLNLCWPVGYQGRDGRSLTMGAADYRRWFARLAENGGNFARIWLSNGNLEPEGEVAGELNLAMFARMDAIIELARRHGIRLKLCLEHFRRFTPGSPQSKKIRLPDGRTPASVAEWFNDAAWQQAWMKKVQAYTARWGDDPTVMAWELWNEINCCDTGDFKVQLQWTRRMLPRIRALSPRNLVVNSLGSFDNAGHQKLQDAFRMDEMDFQQVHRYLDQGAALKICQLPVEFSVDAVKLSRRPDRPVLLAETGAVNDSHTGVFRFCRTDDRGIIFHDTTFPAFFAGAAGTGHNWFWDSYVEQKNLWYQFRAFADLISGIRIDEEGFEAADMSSVELWVLALRGRRHHLLWLRNRADTWQQTLRDGREAPVVAEAAIDLALAGAGGAPDVKVFRPWPDEKAEVALSGGRLVVRGLRAGLMVRVGVGQ